MSSWKNDRSNYHGSGSRDKIPIKCFNYDEITGEKVRDCKPGCPFTHPSDPGWDTASRSRKSKAHGSQNGPRKDTGFHRDGDRTRDDRRPHDAERNQDNGRSSHSRKNSSSQTNVGNTPADVNASNHFSAVWETGPNADDLDTGWGDAVFGTGGVGSNTNWMPTSIEKAGKNEATVDVPAPKSSRTFAPSIDEDAGRGPAARATIEPSTRENNNTSPALNTSASDLIAATPAGKSSFTTTISQAREDNRKEEASAFSHDSGPFPKLTEQPRIRTAANKIVIPNSRWGREKLASPSETSAISRPAYSSRTPIESETKRSAFSPPDTRNASTVDLRHITSQTKDNAKDPRAVHSKREKSFPRNATEDNLLTKPALRIQLPSSRHSYDDGQPPSARPLQSATSGYVSTPHLWVTSAISASGDPPPVSALTDNSVRDQSIQQQVWARHIRTLLQAVSLGQERLHLQKVEQHRQQVMQTIFRKAGRQLPGGSAVLSKLHNETIVKQTEATSKLQFATDILKVGDGTDTTPSSGHWWPTPRINVDYDAAMRSLEEKVRLLQMQLGTLDQEIGDMHLDKRNPVHSIQDEGAVDGKSVLPEHPIQAKDYDLLMEDIEDLVEVAVVAMDRIKANYSDSSTAIHAHIEDKYSSLTTARTGVAQKGSKLEILRRRYAILEQRLSNHLPQLNKIRREELERGMQLGVLKTRLEELRSQQIQILARNKQLIEEAQQILTKMSQSPLPDRIHKVTTSSATKQRVIKELTPKLLAMVERYRTEDLEYMAQKRAKVEADMNTRSAAKTKEMRQRSLEFLEGVKGNNGLITLDTAGQEIDRRWNEVIAIHGVPRRPSATRIIPEAGNS